VAGQKKTVPPEHPWVETDLRFQRRLGIILTIEAYLQTEFLGGRPSRLKREFLLL
jgi:hypothetical protein